MSNKKEGRSSGMRDNTVLISINEDGSFFELKELTTATLSQSGSDDVHAIFFTTKPIEATFKDAISEIYHGHIIPALKGDAE